MLSQAPAMAPVRPLARAPDMVPISPGTCLLWNITFYNFLELHILEGHTMNMYLLHTTTYYIVFSILILPNYIVNQSCLLEYLQSSC